MADAKLAGTLYKILSWSSLAGLFLTIVLVLHKSPAPNIRYDRNAAGRAEQKFAAADQAKASGQPGQVALDRSELNSYLAQNLQAQTLAPVKGATGGAGAGATGNSGAAPDALPDGSRNAGSDAIPALAAVVPRSIE